MTTKKFFCMSLLVLLFTLMLCGCGSDAKKESTSGATETQTTQSNKKVISVATNEPATSQENKQEEEKKVEKQYVQIEMEKGGKIIVELLPNYAPMSVEFFLELVDDKYYNGLTFHRAVENFMIQGGSPNGDGIGGCGRTVKGEFASNGYTNNLSHERGVISFARTSVKDSASGQFFIMHGDASYLDGEYAAFGRVVEGMEVVDEIATSPVSGESLIDKPVIKSVKRLKNYKK